MKCGRGGLVSLSFFSLPFFFGRASRSRPLAPTAGVRRDSWLQSPSTRRLRRLRLPPPRRSQKRIPIRLWKTSPPAARKPSAWGTGEDRQVHAANKLTIRERIALLVDPGSFREIGLLAHSDLPGSARQDAVPADGKVCGFGAVEGRGIYVSGEDATVPCGAQAAGSASRRTTTRCRTPPRRAFRSSPSETAEAHASPTSWGPPG